MKIIVALALIFGFVPALKAGDSIKEKKATFTVIDSLGNTKTYSLADLKNANLEKKTYWWQVKTFATYFYHSNKFVSWLLIFMSVVGLYRLISWLINLFKK